MLVCVSLLTLLDVVLATATAGAEELLVLRGCHVVNHLVVCFGGVVDTIVVFAASVVVQSKKNEDSRSPAVISLADKTRKHSTHSMIGPTITVAAERWP